MIIVQDAAIAHDQAAPIECNDVAKWRDAIL